jgi:hypothetical protein
VSLRQSQSGTGGCNGAGMKSSLALSVAALIEFPTLSLSVFVVADGSIAGGFKMFTVAVSSAGVCM